MGKVEKRAVEVLVRGEGSKPRSPRREHSQLPVGGRTDPATPASDLSSELWQALYLALSKCWHKPRNASGPAQPSSNHSRSPTQLSCPPALPLPHPVMDPIPAKVVQAPWISLIPCLQPSPLLLLMGSLAQVQPLTSLRAVSRGIVGW